MKFRLTFIDQFYPELCLRNAVIESFKGIPLKPEELGEAVELRMEVAKSFLERWISNNESITVEFDAKTNTATVIPNEK